MIPLMGITWLFGLLSPWHKAFAYIFTIFNSTQVSIRSLVVITKSFRLHVHHRQFYSGEILMKMSEIWSSVWKLECPNYILTLVWWYFPFKGNLVDKRGFTSWFLRSATSLNLLFYPFFKDDFKIEITRCLHYIKLFKRRSAISKKDWSWNNFLS